MKLNEESESGFVDDGGAEDGFSHQMHDVEILRVTRVNVIARGRRYGRQWLIKGLREDITDSTAFRHRLMKEFEIHSRLHHPSVAQAVGFEEIDGLGTCLIMEWIDGITLSEAINMGTLTRSERRRIMRETVKVVAYLHSRGVVHRDLKPSNIMIRRAGGEPVLIDFGLADTDDYVELKQPSGTPGFVSPEQIENGGADPADDVYSLGVIMTLLCHEYKGIGRRCMASPHKRPADAKAVLDMIERRERTPKIAILTLAGILVAAAGTTMGMKIVSLSRNASEGENKLTAIMQENSRNLTHVALLNDSLKHVSQRLASAEEERGKIEAYAAAKDNAYQTGCRKLDAILARYDREEFASVDSADMGTALQQLTELTIKVQNELQQTVEQHCKDMSGSGLSDADREKIRMDLYNYYTVSFSDIHSKWLTTIYPERKRP